MRLAAILASALLIAPTLAQDGRPAEMPQAPVAKTEPKVLEAHGQRRIDNYFWLRDRGDPSVLAYLRAENAYAAARLAPLKTTIAELERELRERADVADASPGFADSRFIYRRRTARGAAHPVIVRHMPGMAEQIVLDIESLAAGHEYYELADYAVSPDANRVAFSVDFTGGRVHRLFIRDIATGQVADTGIENAGSDVVFSADSQWLFYVRIEPGALRSHQLWRHAIGSDPSRDQLVYEEPDPTFELQVSSSRSGRFILLKIEQGQSSEVRIIPADQPLQAPTLMAPRRPDVLYNVDHIGNTFYIRTNWNAPDYRLLRAPETAPQADHWSAFIPETPGRLLSEFELFDSFVALVEEHDATQSVRVVRTADLREMPVTMPADIGVTEISFAQGAANRNVASTVLQLRFSGPRNPDAIYDFDTATGELALRQQSPDWNWFDPAKYEVKRVVAVAPDGEQVPVTLTYRKDLVRPGGNPTLISGYGAYGSSASPGFPDSWVSLIDRGFVFAQAHVRGGQEKGSRWYDQGRLLHKPNSFADFIAATEALIAQGYTDPRRVFARGASAGGLLVAVAAERRPDLYAGVVAEVPFVDVVTTMSDPTLPLTTLEYHEWGNPAEKRDYETMLSYSPYDNVTAKPYPAMLVTAALNDSQVGYHEPAKWVARLRAAKTDSNELLFMTNMDAGHTGGSGRFGSSDENAQIMAWLLAQASRPR